MSITKHRALVHESILASLALAIVALIAFGKFADSSKNIATFQDNTYLLLPLFNFISKTFSHGEYPYWMNTIVAGLPLYNVPQLSPAYPFYFFRFGLYNTPLNAMMQVQYVILFHLLILYVNTYLLLRVLRIRPLAAFLGASLLAISPNTFTYCSWVNILASYSWFPLIIAGVYLVLENIYPKVGIIVGAVSFALLILASPSQSLIHAVYVIGVLYFFHALRLLKQKRTDALFSTSKNLFIMGAITLLLAAPSLVPALLNTDTIRFIGDYPAIVGNTTIPFKGFLVGQLEPVHLAGTLLPLAIPAVIGSPFIGIGAAILALLAIFKARTNWIILPLFFISLYALLSATGSHLGFAQLNYQLPYINKIREPGRHLFVFVLGASTLAAFGFQYLIEALDSGYKSVLDSKHLAVAVISLTLIAMAFHADLRYIGSVSKWSLMAICVAAGGALLALSWLSDLGKRVLAIVAVSLIIYANLQYPADLPGLEVGDYFAAENLSSHEILSELAKIEDVRNYRVIFADDKLNVQFWSMNASYYGLRSFQAYMNPLPYRQFQEVFQNFHLRHYYPLLGAKYYLCRRCDDAALLRDYTFQRELNNYKLYSADRALPRYLLVNRVAGFYENKEDFFNKIDAGYDYTKEFYVDKADAAKIQTWLSDESPAANYIIKEEFASLNKLQLSINTERRAVLLLNEYYTKDWKVKVNGKTVEPLKINLNQIGVQLETGSNFVQFEYHPTLFIRLLWVQLFVFGGLVLYALYKIYSSQRYRFNNLKVKESNYGVP